MLANMYDSRTASKVVYFFSGYKKTTQTSFCCFCR